MNIDETIESLTETCREATDPPVSVADALEVLEGVVSNLEGSIAGLRDDLKREASRD